MRAEPAPSRDHTWLVLQRDLSVWLRTVQQPTLATMVLDLTDRGTRAVETGSTVGDSLRETLLLAAREPARGMEPRIPDRIQVPAGIAAALRSELGHLEGEAGFRPDCIVEEVTPEEGAEWVFDDLITKMAGRRPPDERLLPEDATVLYEQARQFMEVEPWTRLASDNAFLAELRIGSRRMEGIVAVMGHQSTQPGLLLMPGRERATEMMASYTAPPIGTLFTQLEGSEGQPDLFMRARRYGWPAEAAVTPSFISVREDGFRELDRRESWPMALTLAGVVAHFQRGDVAETWGNLSFRTDVGADITLGKRPSPPTGRRRVASSSESRSRMT